MWLHSQIATEDNLMWPCNFGMCRLHSLYSSLLQYLQHLLCVQWFPSVCENVTFYMCHHKIFPHIKYSFIIADCIRLSKLCSRDKMNEQYSRMTELQVWSI